MCVYVSFFLLLLCFLEGHGKDTDLPLNIPYKHIDEMPSIILSSHDNNLTYIQLLQGRKCLPEAHVAPFATLFLTKINKLAF